MAHYPKPQVPTQPVLSFASLGRDAEASPPGVLSAVNVRFVTSGRLAIALALKQMGIGKNDKVLLPAYHCSSMVNPVVWAGATPVFYRINPDTSVDLEDVRSKLDSGTRLLLAANYFGFPQPLPAIRAFCDRHGLMLIEDCAHAFFGQCDGKPLGSYGDYAIGSCTKFFPVFDGGCLVSARHSLESIALQAPGTGFQLKAALNTIERGFAYRRMEPLRMLAAPPMRVKDYLWSRMKKKSPTGRIALSPGASEGGFEFEPAWMDKRSSLMSRFIVACASRQRIASKRRENYRTLELALAGLPGIRPLFPALRAGVVPYVLPMVVSEPQTVFPMLKQAGVPVIRFAEFLWEGVDARTCPVSVDLSRRVMQFPCHQELTSAELEWLIETIKGIFLSCGHREDELETLSCQ